MIKGIRVSTELEDQYLAQTFSSNGKDRKLSNVIYSTLRYQLVVLTLTQFITSITDQGYADNFLRTNLIIFFVYVTKATLFSISTLVWEGDLVDNLERYILINIGKTPVGLHMNAENKRVLIPMYKVLSFLSASQWRYII
jgi:hypothetical protein